MLFFFERVYIFRDIVYSRHSIVLIDLRSASAKSSGSQRWGEKPNPLLVEKCVFRVKVLVYNWFIAIAKLRENIR